MVSRLLNTDKQKPQTPKIVSIQHKINNEVY